MCPPMSLDELTERAEDVAFRELSIVYGVDTLPVRLW